ncbi:MAG TPA: B-box zinc finger protein [Aggregatilineaceae bacterium]|nr:B-box zinc finger protein [Aggregatilineaceae bacterium]
MTISEQTQTSHMEEDGLTYCTVHPTVATNLHCNRCGRPMCTKCAVRTPVGYRCRDCVRQQQNTFFNAQMLDYVIAAAVTLLLGFMAAGFLSMIRWFFIAFFIGPAAGGAIGQVIMRLTNKRRGRYTGLVVGVCMVLSALPFILVNPLGVGIYLVMATSTAVAQFGLRLSV